MCVKEKKEEKANANASVRQKGKRSVYHSLHRLIAEKDVGLNGKNNLVSYSWRIDCSSRLAIGRVWLQCWISSQLPYGSVWGIKEHESFHFIKIR